MKKYKSDCMGSCKNKCVTKRLPQYRSPQTILRSQPVVLRQIGETDRLLRERACNVTVTGDLARKLTKPTLWHARHH